jgi:UDP-glucose 4-epimerase
VRNPLEYYRNNTCASRNLIASCVSKGVRHFVFSSTAAVYGNPAAIPVTEDMPTTPMNPYGASKLMTEWILRDAAARPEIRFATLFQCRRRRSSQARGPIEPCGDAPRESSL